MSESQRRCPHCGRVQMFDDQICPYCGQDLDGRKRRETVHEKARRQRKAVRAGRNGTGDPESWQGRGGRTADTGKYIVLGIGLMILALQLLVVLSHKGLLEPFRKPEGNEAVLQVTTEAAEETETTEVPTETAAPETTETPAPEEAESETGEPEYLPFSREEEDSLQPDALWKSRERWEKAYPDVMGLELIAMEKTAGLIEDNSRESLIQMMKKKLIPRKTAERILDRFEIDFNIQCYKCMRSYLRYSGFSPVDMENQLEYEGFTPEEIRYAMGREEVDWYDQIGFWVYDTQEYSAYSESGLLEKLKEEGFDPEDIEKWHETAEIDYKEQAVKRAQALDKIYLGFNYYMLMELLQQEGFTEGQAEYAAQVLELK